MAVTKSKEHKHGTSLCGKYELIQLLDHGACAKVYHARSIVGGEAMTIKVLDKTGLNAIAIDVPVPLKEYDAISLLKGRP
ncbi:CBL-interacting protein kinase 7 [Hordeum vulgare]|nr:CBL-interacting protein kinase 7 [Hordeum vulgare]